MFCFSSSGMTNYVSSLLSTAKHERLIHAFKKIGKDCSKKVKGFFISNAIVFMIIVTFVISYYLLLNKITLNFNVLSLIIVSASLIVTLTMGFIFQEYKDINILRREKLNRFAELQRELIPYQRAFVTLSRQLMNKNKQIDFLLGKDYIKLRKNMKFWENNKNAYGIDFVKALYEFGSDHFNMPDYETDYSIISKKFLEIMHHAIVELSSLLARRKHYKYVFENLGIKENKRFGKTIIADESDFLKYEIKPIIKNYSGNWKSVDFWQLKIEEVLDILDKMEAASIFIYSYTSKTITKFSKHFIILSLFGILTPLSAIALKNIISLKSIQFLTNLSVIGFMIFFDITQER